MSIALWLVFISDTTYFSGYKSDVTSKGNDNQIEGKENKEDKDNDKNKDQKGGKDCDNNLVDEIE